MLNRPEDSNALLVRLQEKLANLASKANEKAGKK